MLRLSREMQIPILANFQFALTYYDVMAGLKLVDILEESILSGSVVKREEPVDRGRFNFSANFGIGQNRLHLGREDQRFGGRRIVKRFDPQAVPRDKQELVAIIPDGESEHSPQLFDAILTELFIEMDDYFRIRACLEDMSPRQ